MEQPELKDLYRQELGENYRLDPDQYAAFLFILESFTRMENPLFSQLLGADTGYGKTRVAIWVIYHFFKVLGMKPFIICPAKMVNQWEKHLNNCKIPFFMVISYESLTGKAASGCKHPYLNRGEERHGPFYVTEEWLKIIRDPGVMIILDELQSVKNDDAAKHRAVFQLVVSCRTTPGTKSALLGLSASPIDKKNNFVCLYRILGIITGREMWHTNPQSGRLEYGPTKKRPQGYAFKWLLDQTRRIDDRAVAELLYRFEIKAEKLPFMLIYLWQRVYRDLHMVPVVDPIYEDPVTGRIYDRIRVNLFATLDEEGQEYAEAGIAMLRQAHIVTRNGEIDLDRARRNQAIITRALQEICKGKINTVARLALQKLREGKKVIIGCPFLEDQERLMNMLELYHPIRITGSDKGDGVQQKAALFNEPNMKYQCIVMTTQVGGIGLDFHDVHGPTPEHPMGFPRCTFVIPTHRFLDNFQCVGRSYRRGLRSDTEAYIVYSNNTAIESVLVNSLNKTEVADLVLVPGSGRKYPGAYDFIIEDEGEQHAELRRRLEGEKAKAKEDMIKNAQLD